MKSLGIKTIDPSTLIQDFSFYPRHTISNLVVSDYVRAAISGADFPPIRVEKSTSKIIDGYHRWMMHKKLGNQKIKVEMYEFNDDKDFFWHAVHWNSDHGERLTSYDKSRVLIVGRKFGMTDEEISAALQITLKKVEKISINRIRQIKVDMGSLPTKTAKPIFEPIAVKRIIADATIGEVTPKLIEAQKSMGGLAAIYFIEEAHKILKYDLLKVNERNLKAVKLLAKEANKWLDKTRN